MKSYRNKLNYVSLHQHLLALNFVSLTSEPRSAHEHQNNKVVSKKRKETELDFEIDKLTNSIENSLTDEILFCIQKSSFAYNHMPLMKFVAILSASMASALAHFRTTRSVPRKGPVLSNSHVGLVRAFGSWIQSTARVDSS